MMGGRTIIQPIGPLYGEAVNGTVYGRPNGSIYVPPTNTITLNIIDNYEYIRSGTGAYAKFAYPCDSQGNIPPAKVETIAESQDNAAYIAVQVSDDSDFSTYDETTAPAGMFNRKASSFVNNLTNVTLVDGSTYYVRAVLYAGTGVPVAYSEIKELTAVVPA